ncbi:Serine palmitoyltransferase 1 [Coccomyxa sp. Obi]|nr:Serine palmitoyltransferase 1 [Coccomyxa sp. Obi]
MPVERARNATQQQRLTQLQEMLPLSLSEIVSRAKMLLGTPAENAIPVGLLQAVRDFWDLLKPGGKLHPTYIIEHQGHLVFEVVLTIVIAYLLFQRSYKPSAKQEKPLTEKEMDELCAEWQPEPLCGPLTDAQKNYEPPVISSAAGAYVVANGKKALNMVSFNFLGVAGEASIKEAARATINKYGVGSCGPRGFYGTIDVHLDLEERLARFMGTEESIIYSYDLATIPSVLPAFANAKDLIVCDEGVSYPIQNGCHLSRASIRRFRHNDMADLERVLQEVDAEYRRLRKPLNRRFIVVEGIYLHSGDLAPLADIYRLKEKYKYRLVVDESLALGVLGEHGRGACEHWGLRPGDAEIVSASIGNALGSVGGFCAGDREIVDHQRLSGLGYCFSASLPPFLATAAIGALDVLESDAPRLLPALASNARLLHSRLADIPGVEVEGTARDAVSPVAHVRLAEQPDAPDQAQVLLQRVVDAALKRGGVLFTVHRVSPLDRVRPPPSIRVVVTAMHTEKDVLKAVAALAAAVKEVCKVSRVATRSSYMTLGGA